jgi:hypothetical protein
VIARLNCSSCGIGFRGRADAIYCSSACRQKAHRGRTARRIAALAEQQRSGPLRRPTVIRPDVAGTIQRAYELQRRARERCRAAADALLQVLASQRRSRNRSSVRARSTTPTPPSSGWAAIDHNAEDRP